MISGWFGGGRPIDRTNPDPSSQELTVDLEVLGGYDEIRGIDELTFAGSDAQYAGAIGAGAIDAQHRWGTRRNFLESSLIGNLRLASRGIDQQVAGRSGVRGLASVGRRSSAGAAFGVAYEPTYLFNAFGGLNLAQDSAVLTTINQAEGTTEQRWVGTSGSARLDRHWTTRQRSEIEYVTSARKPLTGPGLETETQEVGLRHEWSPLERTSIHFRYHFTDNRQNTIIAFPLRLNHAGVDLSWRRRLVRNRSVSISFGGGATHTRREQLVPGEQQEFFVSRFVVPSGSLAMQLNVSAGWALSFNATRDVTMLEGLSPEPFTTEAFALAMIGRLGRHTEVRLTGAYSQGTATTSSEGRFETTVGTAQWRYSLARCCAVTAMYMHYDHQFADLAFAPIGFPSSHRRNSIRAGMSFWLPLFGSFQSE